MNPFVENIVYCNFCSKSFNSKNGLQNHVDSKHSAASNIQCNCCVTQYESIIKHMDRYKANYTLPSTSNSHSSSMLSLNARTGVVCNLCQKGFRLQADLNQHLFSKHGFEFEAQTFENTDHSLLHCSFCMKSFATKKRLQKHIQYVHKKSDTSFHTLGAMQQHKSAAHPDIIYCEQCNKTFRRSFDLLQHTEAVHKNQIQCNQCFKTFKKQMHLKQHKDAVHAVKPSPTYQEDVYFPCMVCSRLFPTKADKDIHFEQAHMHFCSFCTKKFNDIIQLEQHKVDKHKNIDYFPCTFCTKEFTSDSGRTAHMEVTHTFTCNICFKQFNESLQLQQHKHSKHQTFKLVPVKEPIPSKMFQCQYCSKIFHDATILQQHKEFKHKNIHYFPCEYCPQHFESNISRRNHFIGIHSDMSQRVMNSFNVAKRKKIICTYCLKSFDTNEDLKRHQLQLHKSLSTFGSTLVINKKKTE